MSDDKKIICALPAEEVLRLMRLARSLDLDPDDLYRQVVSAGLSLMEATAVEIDERMRGGKLLV